MIFFNLSLEISLTKYCYPMSGIKKCHRLPGEGKAWGYLTYFVNLTYTVFFFFYVLYSTLLHLPPLRFHSVEGCWDRTQDCCDFGIGSQTL
jgi:hypothetical protein